MMKHIALMCGTLAVVVSTVSPALAGGETVGDKALRIAERVKGVESELIQQNDEQIRYHLNQINSIVSQYDNGQVRQALKLSCASNGDDFFEAFRVKDQNTGTKYGGETSRRVCERVVEAAKNNLVCVSDGADEDWEKFRAADLGAGKLIGGWTSLNTCLGLVKDSSRNKVCVSNGEGEDWEKFRLVDRKTLQYISGEMSYTSCLSLSRP